MFEFTSELKGKSNLKDSVKIKINATNNVSKTLVLLST